MGEEKGKKPSEKPTVKQVLDEGRALAPIARRDPELFEAIREFAENEGINTVEATTLLLKRHLLLQKVETSNLNVQQLMVAWDILREMMKMNIWMFTSMGSLFFSEMTQAMGQIIEERVNQKLSSLDIGQEKKSANVDKFKEKLFDIIEPMLDTVMTSMFRASGQPIPDKLKVKIPVDINIKDSGGNAEGNEQKPSDSNTQENIQEVKS